MELIAICQQKSFAMSRAFHKKGMIYQVGLAKQN